MTAGKPSQLAPRQPPVCSDVTGWGSCGGPLQKIVRGAIPPGTSEPGAGAKTRLTKNTGGWREDPADEEHRLTKTVWA